MEGPSSYLDYLPGIHAGNEFLGRFLMVFESVLGPIERMVDNFPHYFDPAIAPAECVDWLGSWLGFVFDERWPESRRRDLVSAAGDLYRWRGTAWGLAEYIRLATGITPEVLQPSVSDVAVARNRAFRFTVRLRAPDPAAVDRELVEAIIDTEKPAFAACTLEIVAA